MNCEFRSAPGELRDTCVVSVVVGGDPRYHKALERMKARLEEVGYSGAWALWRGYPTGSPLHADQPYGFKVHAVEAVRAVGFKRVVWLDSEAFPVKPLGPMLDELSRRGVISVSGHDKLGEWCSDDALAILGITREQAHNADNIRVQAGKIYGFNFRSDVGGDFFSRWAAALRDGVFKGFAINTGAGPEVEAASRAALGNRPAGFCSSDPRVRGHRHDEVAAGFLVAEMGIESGTVNEWMYAAWSRENAAKPDIYFCGADGHGDPR